MKKSIATSLIVSTYNWPEALKLCLNSILKQSVLPSEIIIADDGSTEETQHVIKEFASLSPVPILHVCHQDKGFRLAIIRNKAIARSNNEYVIQIDGDLILHRHFIKDHLQIAKKKCFIRGTRVNLTQEDTAELFKKGKLSLPAICRITMKQPINALHLPRLFSRFITRKELSGLKVKGCNMAFWKEDLIAVNGYNNMFEGWGHEDVELSVRLVNSGIHKKIIKFAAIVYHINHNTVPRDNEENNIKALEETNKKHLTYAESGLKEATNID